VFPAVKLAVFKCNGSDDGRQLEVPVVLPHSEMLPKIVRVSGQDSGIGESMKIHRPAGQYCRILYLVGKAEAGSGGDQPAKE
jgi:hypothetical protein